MRRVCEATVAGILLVAATVQADADTAGSIPSVVSVPAGAFIFGSDQTQREAGYQLDEAAYGHSITRTQQWYEYEHQSQEVSTDTYAITRTPITNAQYRAFVDATGHTAPDVAPAVWAGYRLVHPYERTRRHAWEGGQLPEGREAHPVVLVAYEDAVAYADWLSSVSGFSWRLPTELEWEKAARGIDGRWFPWGNEFDARKLNSHDDGPFDTVPVGAFSDGASPFGVLDAAGQVFEWTSTKAGDSRYIVKGGSWDDKGCGVCRSSARHSRPKEIKHILIGFRLVRE